MPAEAGVRRNGRPKACEPCRKGKLACDHALPFCGRCTRRGMTARCIYHPAPMTRAKLAEKPSPLVQPVRNIVSIVSTRPEISSHDLGAGGKLPPSMGASIAERGTRRRGLFKRTTRFQGSTSFSAVFVENPGRFELGTSELEKEADAIRESGLHPLLREDREAAAAADLALGIKALLNFPTRELSHRLMELFGLLHEISLMEPLITVGIHSIWSTFGDCLVEPRTEANVYAFAEKLCQNAVKPPQSEPEDAMEWINSFVGPNLTWEVMGITFSCLGMSYWALQESDPVFTDPSYNRKQAAWRMKECTDACLKMCDTTDTVNDFVVCLMMNYLILESFCVGDESYQLWRRHGDLVGAVFATGLHRLPDPATTPLTFSSWVRTRLFCACYGLDKSHCVFNGLPPGLSRFYCKPWVPFDLDVNDVIAGPQVTARAIDLLDAQGWNTAGKIYPVTLERVVIILFRIREEILELSLRVKMDALESRIQDLLRRCHEVYDSFPSHLKYRPTVEVQMHTAHDYYAIVTSRLQHLQNIFVLHRIASVRLQTSFQELVDNAREQMKLILSFWLQRDYLLSFNINFDWILTAYGIPCRGVLCVELLKQVRHESNLQFPRSEVIRQLTLFVGFLEWVRPSDGNYVLCQRLAKVVQHIIDHVIDQPPQPASRVVGFDMPGLELDPMLLPFDGFDCLDWLNAADWTQGPLVDSR